MLNEWDKLLSWNCRVALPFNCNDDATDHATPTLTIKFELLVTTTTHWHSFQYYNETSFATSPRCAGDHEGTPVRAFVVSSFVLDFLMPIECHNGLRSWVWRSTVSVHSHKHESFNVFCLYSWIYFNSSSSACIISPLVCQCWESAMLFFITSFCSMFVRDFIQKTFNLYRYCADILFNAMIIWA